MRTKSFLTFMLAVVTAICFTSCADDNDEGWRAVSAADYKVFTDAKAAFLNNPQNVGTPMYETLIYLTEKPQAVKAQEVEGGTNYEFYFSICNVSIAKGILDEVGYIVNTSIHNDGVKHGAVILDDATRLGWFIQKFDAIRHGAYNNITGVANSYVIGGKSYSTLTIMPSSAQYPEICKVFTDAKAAFLNNPQNVGKPIYEILNSITDMPTKITLKSSITDNSDLYDFDFSAYMVYIKKYTNQKDEVGIVTYIIDIKTSQVIRP